ncbi:MAG: exodeoxyribonuclease VII small subunit [Ignavibacteriaceae bacterium]
MKKKNDSNSFELNLTRLEEISVLLESENIGLEEALLLYEEGISLSKVCIDTLKNAELKIIELRKKVDEIPGISAEKFEE